MSKSTEIEMATLEELRNAVWRCCRNNFTDDEIKDAVEISIQGWRDAVEKENGR